MIDMRNTLIQPVMQKLLQYQSDYPPGITGDAYSVYRQQACATGSIHMIYNFMACQ
jgi:hypothetical protein